MPRAIYVIRDGQLVDKHDASPLYDRADAPNVIVDTMAPTFNHATGLTYDSKRAFERDTRAAGCVIVGNDRSAMERRAPAEMPDVRRDVQRAIAELRGRQ